MTLLELITDLRTRLLDDTGGEGVDWTDPTKERLLRWSNEELTVLINEAMRLTARRVKSITDNYSISVRADTNTYTLNPLMFKIRRARMSAANTRNNLDEVSWKDLDALRNDWEIQTGDPTAYVLDWEKGKIRLYPTPTTADTLNLNGYRYPEEDMDFDNWDSDEPELELEYQRDALYWAAKLAYEKDEPNIIDPGRSEEMEAKYTMCFGMPESAYSIERKKRAKRKIAYGGIRQGDRRARGNYKSGGYW